VTNVSRVGVKADLNIVALKKKPMQKVMQMRKKKEGKRFEIDLLFGDYSFDTDIWIQGERKWIKARKIYFKSLGICQKSLQSFNLEKDKRTIRLKKKIHVAS